MSTATSSENSPESTFASVAYWMGIVGRVNILLAFLATVGLVFGFDLLLVASGLITLLIGIATLNTAAAFRRVAVMDDDAPQRLEEAAVSLRNLFRLCAIAIAVYAAIFAITAVLFVLFSFEP